MMSCRRETADSSHLLAAPARLPRARNDNGVNTAYGRLDPSLSPRSCWFAPNVVVIPSGARDLHFHAANHAYCSFFLNENAGSRSTGTSATDFSAACNSGVTSPYFLNQFSARWRSPVASIVSNSLVRLSIAPGMRAWLTE